MTFGQRGRQTDEEKVRATDFERSAERCKPPLPANEAHLRELGIDGNFDPQRVEGVREERRAEEGDVARPEARGEAPRALVEAAARGRLRIFRMRSLHGLPAHRRVEPLLAAPRL